MSIWGHLKSLFGASAQTRLETTGAVAKPTVASTTAATTEPASPSPAGVDGATIARAYRERMRAEIADIESRSLNAGLLEKMREHREEILKRVTDSVVRTLAQENACSTAEIADVLVRHRLPEGAPDPFAGLRGPGHLLDDEAAPDRGTEAERVDEAAEALIRDTARRIGISAERLDQMDQKYGGVSGPSNRQS